MMTGAKHFLIQFWSVGLLHNKKNIWLIDPILNQVLSDHSLLSAWMKNWNTMNNCFIRSLSLNKSISNDTYWDHVAEEGWSKVWGCYMMIGNEERRFPAKEHTELITLRPFIDWRTPAVPADRSLFFTWISWSLERAAESAAPWLTLPTLWVKGFYSVK